MELRQKKRLIGAVVLVGIVLIQLPFLFHKSPSVHQENISLQIPSPPTPPVVLPESKVAPTNDPAVKQQAVVSKKINIDTHKDAEPVSTLKKDSPAPVQLSEKKQKATVAIVTKKTKSSKISPVKNSKVIAQKAEVHIKKKHTDSDSFVAWSIQLGVFSDEANAKELLGQLRLKGYESYMRRVNCGGKKCMVVYVGPELHLSVIKKVQAGIAKNFHLNGMVKKYQI